VNRRDFILTSAATLVAAAVPATGLASTPPLSLDIPRTVLADPELRKVQVFTMSGWAKAEWGQLKKGHIFRLVEPDGSPVDGGEINIATADAVVRPPPEFYSVQCDPYTKPLAWNI